MEENNKFETEPHKVYLNLVVFSQVVSEEFSNHFKMGLISVLETKLSKNFRKIKIKAWNILQLVHINIQFKFKLILVWNVAILAIWRNCYF